MTRVVIPGFLNQFFPGGRKVAVIPRRSFFLLPYEIAAQSRVCGRAVTSRRCGPGLPSVWVRAASARAARTASPETQRVPSLYRFLAAVPQPRPCRRARPQAQGPAGRDRKAGVVTAYKNLKHAERDFRSVKADD